MSKKEKEELNITFKTDVTISSEEIREEILSIVDGSVADYMIHAIYTLYKYGCFNENGNKVAEYLFKNGF